MQGKGFVCISSFIHNSDDLTSKLNNRPACNAELFVAAFFFATIYNKVTQKTNYWNIKWLYLNY